MRKLKRTAIGILILALFYGFSYLIPLIHPPRPSTQVLSAVSEVTLFTQPESGARPIIAAINKASRSIKVEVYLLSDKDIIKALEEARLRGIDVKVILEHHPFGGSTLNPKTKTELEKANIPVHWSAPEFALTHEKSIIIDERQLFVLGQNLTTSAFSKNREYDIIDDNPADVKEAVNIFTADWNNTTFTPTDSHLIVSPINSRTGITTLLQKATREIDIEIEDINDRGIVNLLIEKSKSLKVRLVAPTINQIKSNKDSLVSLSKSGIQVHTLSSPYIHAKLILIDNSLAYTGSVNLSAQSMDHNRELGIILGEKDIIQDLHNYFEKDWSNSLEF